MTARVSKRRLQSAADGAARAVSGTDEAAGKAASQSPSPDGRTGDAPTPFYDHLMSLIDATAEENKRIQQYHVVQAALPAPEDRRRIYLLIPCIAGLIVVAGLGRSMLVSEVSQTPPPVVTADADSALEDRPPVPGNAGSADEPASGSLPVTEADNPAPADSEEGRTQPRVATAAADSALEGRPPVPGNAGSADEPASGSLPVVEAGGPARLDSEMGLTQSRVATAAADYALEERLSVTGGAGTADGQAPGSGPPVEPEGMAATGSAASRTQGPAGTTAAESEDPSPAIGNADASDELVQRPQPAARPDDPIGDEEKQTAEGGTGTAAVAAAEADERPTAAPVAGEVPSESPGSGTDPRNNGPVADTQASTAAERTAAADPVANPPSDPPANVRSPAPPAEEAAATAEQERTSPARRLARVVSDVNMRAGPGNSKAVLARLRKGTPVEVIDCRHWCEVIYSGQRGWIYKRFVGGGSHQLN